MRKTKTKEADFANNTLRDFEAVLMTTGGRLTSVKYERGAFHVRASKPMPTDFHVVHVRLSREFSGQTLVELLRQAAAWCLVEE